MMTTTLSSLFCALGLTLGAPAAMQDGSQVSQGPQRLSSLTTELDIFRHEREARRSRDKPI